MIRNKPHRMLVELMVMLSSVTHFPQVMLLEGLLSDLVHWYLGKVVVDAVQPASVDPNKPVHLKEKGSMHVYCCCKSFTRYSTARRWKHGDILFFS